MAAVTKNVEVAGRRISIETGRVAEQANGAVVIRQGDTVVLSTAVMANEPREGIDFFPLTCDYEEKLYAAGKIPGAFMRREGRPSEQAILASRLTDRPLRPLFPDGFRLDVQVISTVLSVDQENDPTILSINGASTALVISDIPFQGPVGAVRMGYLDGKVVVNPPMSQMGESELDLVVAGTADAILMVEAGARGVSEQVVLDALATAHEEIKRICDAQLDLQRQVGLEKREWISFGYPEQMQEIVGEYLALRLDQVLYSADKAARESAVDELRTKTIIELGERFPEHIDIIGKLFDKAVKDRVRQRVVEEGIRVDGRGLKDVRPITVEVGVLPRTHGSGLFTRGQTQALSSNGSTSMASVCGSTLALMDAGVPIKSPVAGIAMGLVTREGRFAVLTDIQGVEDVLGDMDFKVAGTRDGITALQMDIKIKGLTHEIMAQALEQAREARLFVLDKMLGVLPRPRSEMSSFAPRITTILINPDKIRDVIGPGGKMIRRITEETGAQIDVEDDGRVFIAAVDQEAGKKAIDWIKSLTDEVEVGKIYEGKVVRIMPFGAFVEVLPGQDGLVHISKLTDHRVERVEEVCNIGDTIMVKAVEIDSQGRLNLSRQAAIEELTAKGLPIEENINPEVMAAALASPAPSREGGFGGRGGRNGGGRDRRPRRD